MVGRAKEIRETKAELHHGCRLTQAFAAGDPFLLQADLWVHYETRVAQHSSDISKAGVEWAIKCKYVLGTNLPSNSYCGYIHVYLPI